MMTTPASASPRPSRTRRVLLVGFLVGLVLPTPAVVLALLVPAAESWAPLLAPGMKMLHPLSPWMATWPGGVNWLLGSLVNGLVLGDAAACVALVLRRRPR